VFRVQTEVIGEAVLLAKRDGEYHPCLQLRLSLNLYLLLGFHVLCAGPVEMIAPRVLAVLEEPVAPT
jgi:hypothetical protein